MTDGLKLMELALKAASKALQAIKTKETCSVNEAALVDDLRTIASWAKCGAEGRDGSVRPEWLPLNGSKIDRIIQRWGPS